MGSFGRVGNAFPAVTHSFIGQNQNQFSFWHWGLFWWFRNGVQSRYKV